MLDSQEFADAIRLAVTRSGLANGRGISEAGYISMAGTIIDYLKENLEVVIPSESLAALEEKKTGTEIKCRIT